MKVRRIKNKILGSAILIVTLSLTLISFLAFQRFFSILEEQSLRDDVIHVEQVTDRINGLVDDVYKYSANMVNDEVLQQFSAKVEYPSVYEELLAYSEVVKQLTKFNVLRDYLDSSAIIRSDGKVYWSSQYFDPYFQREIGRPWYQDAIHLNAKSGFTAPHELQDHGEKKVISFFIQFDSQYGGVLLLNIKYEAFTRLFDSLGLSFDEYGWKDEDHGFLLQQGLDKLSLNVITDQDDALVSVSKDRNGYYLNRQLDRTKWSVVTFKSRSHFYHLLTYVGGYWAVFLGLCLGLCYILFLPIITNITRPISEMSKAMKQVSMGNYDVRLSFRSNDELSVLKGGFESMLQDIKREMSERAAQEKWKRRTEAELLFAQINPHFIYNTLNTVVYLARKKNYGAIEEMVESFIGILHDAVKIGSKSLYVLVYQEMEIIDHYVRIQKYRYGDRFELFWHVEDGAKMASIPKSILQPLVENSIYHGFSEKSGLGKVDITIGQLQDGLLISVRDNGIGIAAEDLKKIEAGELKTGIRNGMKHIGIANIRERLVYLCGEAASVMIHSSEGVGTEVLLHIPLTPMIPD